MARRFIVKQKDIIYIDDNSFKISGSEVRHIHVLRYNVNEEIVVNEYVCKIKEVKKDSIVLQKVRLAPKFGEPKVNLTLYVAMLKGDKMDLVVQKAVELGCKKIVPFFSKNVVVKLDDKTRIKRKEKLQVIADEACKQCGRTDKVEILNFISFKEMALNLENYDINFFAYENEKENFHNIIDNLKNKNMVHLSCIIGPEGGFDITEVEEIKKYPNVRCVSLGNRILRAETAVFKTISVIMYEFDD